MKSDIIKNKSQIVDKVFNIKVEEKYRDLEYTIISGPVQNVTSTGLLKVFEISPLNNNLPLFVGRYEEKTKDLDIDIINVGFFEKRKFNHRNSQKYGYEGHHSKMISSDPRIYQVDIKIPGRVVFFGEVQFNINTALILKEVVTFNLQFGKIVAKLKRSSS